VIPSGAGARWCRHRATERSIHLDEKVPASSSGGMRSQVALAFVAGMALILSLAGCRKKSGQAVVLEKEHIAAREIIATPKVEQTAFSSGPTANSNVSAPNEDDKPRELGKDEIVVDTYVMKKDARGSSRDLRAMSDEQWIVTVQMVNDLRRFNVRTDKLHWDTMKAGDRIKVSYHQGKYTGTVWAAEID
jgi:hypothetical protein